MKILYLTGMSNFGNETLSDIQINFLKKINCLDESKIMFNFPYRNIDKKYQKPNIIKASISNALQYYLSRTNWINKYKKNLIEIIEKEDKIFLLVGSCGLEIFNNMKIDDKDNKIHLICYGAVARESPKIKNKKLILGDMDWIAKLWIKEKDLEIKSSHMDYLKSEDLLNYVNNYIKVNS